jgi:hypothetical protein
MLPSLLSLFTEKPREPRRSKMAEKREASTGRCGESGYGPGTQVIAMMKGNLKCNITYISEKF